MKHVLFDRLDTALLSGVQLELVAYGGLSICKNCGMAESELDAPCKPRTPVVTFRTASGVRQGRLVRENSLTAIVKPHLWIKSDPIKIHKIKSGMQFTGKWI